MPTDLAMKIGADHLRRDAFLYVRQSSLRQVFENTESTKRQYALRDRAVALGWPIERIHVIEHATYYRNRQRYLKRLLLFKWQLQSS